MTKIDPPLNLTGEGLVTRMVIVLLGALFQAGVNEGTAYAQESLPPGPSARVIGTFGIRFPGSGNPSRFLTMSPVAYFANADSAYGSELWRSDGTESGTFLLKDLAPGRQSSGIRFLTAAGSLLYFTSDNGSRLWKSDGTGPGTVEVRSVGPENSAFPVQFTELAAMGNSLYFRGTGPSPSAGGELWRTDGTASGTVLIKDIQPGPGDSDPVRLTTVGNVLYFGAATNAQGRELWKSDGTEAGTQLVKDANPGASHVLGTAPEETTCHANCTLSACPRRRVRSE